ncbi:MAG: DUF2088 domain-containing protein [Acidobacteriota bacterium]|nr:MAG: DUF2088 domain-containing protein [Acidobacteriota bacterium]
MKELPRVATFKQSFPRPRLECPAETLREAIEHVSNALPPVAGKRIAVCAGSRGIANLESMVKACVESLRRLGADPFIVPAMGSHGGATAEGQVQVLAEYGITERSTGAPIVSTLETVEIGTTPDGIPVRIDRAAWQADGIVLVNRVKPHTDFKGEVESGLLKMIAVGLGNVGGASDFHSAVQKFAHDRIIRTKAEVLLATGKVLLGLAVVENAYHETAQIQAFPAAEMVGGEIELLVQAKKLMPSLPVEVLDLLVLDEIGKNISGAGMDPNITGRWFKGSSVWQESPDIRRIAVLGISPESHGNGIGIGLADFCSARFVAAFDRKTTYRNVITSQNTVTAGIPMSFATDREVLHHAIDSLGERFDREEVRMVRIKNTLELATIEVSESVLRDLAGDPSELREIGFETNGNLQPISGEWE